MTGKQFSKLYPIGCGKKYLLSILNSSNYYFGMFNCATQKMPSEKNSMQKLKNRL